VLVSRDEQFIVLRGATTVLDGDRLLLLADEASLEEVRRIVGVSERRAVTRSGCRVARSEAAPRGVVTATVASSRTG
jgi:hypothetical protein